MVGLADVGRHDEAFAADIADQRRGLVELGDGARGGNDIGAAVGKAHSHRTAKSASGAGDQHELAVELEAIENHHLTPDLLRERWLRNSKLMVFGN